MVCSTEVGNDFPAWLRHMAYFWPTAEGRSLPRVDGSRTHSRRL